MGTSFHTWGHHFTKERGSLTGALKRSKCFVCKMMVLIKIVSYVKTDNIGETDIKSGAAIKLWHLSKMEIQVSLLGLESHVSHKKRHAP